MYPLAACSDMSDPPLRTILLAIMRAIIGCAPVKDAKAPSPAPVVIIPMLPPKYSCALTARASASAGFTPAFTSSSLTVSYTAPLMVPAPIAAPTAAVVPRTAAVGAPATVAARPAIITGAEVPNAVTTASTGAIEKALIPAASCAPIPLSSASLNMRAIS